MIDLPMNVIVYCSDGIAGCSTHIIGNPINKEITHLVIRSFRPPFSEYLVPVDQVEETADDRIKLKCTRNELIQMEPFETEVYVRTDSPGYLSWPGVPPAVGYRSDLYWPYVPPATGAGSAIDWPSAPPEIAFVSDKGDSYVPVKQRNLPPGGVALRYGARVEATDGHIGQADELLINSDTMQVTHLVLVERHIFQQREITVPVSQIDHIDEGTIYLKLDRQSVEELPSAPIQRRT